MAADTPSSLEIKFYLLSHLDTLMVAFLFAAPLPSSAQPPPPGAPATSSTDCPILVRYAVSVVFPAGQLPRFMEVREVIENKTALLVHSLRALLTVLSPHSTGYITLAIISLSQ
jgi:hypothetical protein